MTIEPKVLEDKTVQNRLREISTELERISCIISPNDKKPIIRIELLGEKSEGEIAVYAYATIQLGDNWYTCTTAKGLSDLIREAEEACND